jgi:LacI family transcriptional regulator
MTSRKGYYAAMETAPITNTTESAPSSGITYPKQYKVAFVVPGLGSNARALLKGVSRYSRIHTSWHLRISTDKIERVLPKLRQIGVDGAFVAFTSGKEVSEVVDTGLPTIALQCRNIPKVVPYVTANSYAGGRMAAEHLLERGFKNFAYYSLNSLFWSRQRMESFCSRISEAGYTTSVYKLNLYRKPSQQGTVGYTHDWQGRTWMKELDDLIRWLRSLPKPVGLMACDDGVAYDIIEAADEAGIHVPEQMAVIGMYNDETICSVANPTLSSIAVDLEQAGYNAAEFLESLMCGRIQMEGQCIRVEPTHVVARQSTDTLAINDRDVATALHYIRQHFNAPIQVADVVSCTTASRRSLEIRFREFVKRSIMEEIMRVRVEHIAVMLIESEMSMERIAAASAFESTSHMIQVFKQHKGMTPLAFRKIHRVT